MNILKKENLDFYNDFYNILEENEKQWFYSVCEEEDVLDINNLSPDDFFMKYYVSWNEERALKELIIRLINRRLLLVSVTVKMKWVLDDLNIDMDTQDLYIELNWFVSLDNGSVINIDGNIYDNEDFFDKIYSVDEYIEKIENLINEEK